MSFSLKKAMLATAALGLALSGPASAQVPDPFARQLAQSLARVEHVVTANGYQRAAGPFAGGLAAREGRRFSVMLRAGQDYRIVGVCDARCSDLDLRVFDMNNTLAAQDVQTDDIPVLHIRPAATGLHTIEVVMYRCTGDPCYFAFNVYSN